MYLHLGGGVTIPADDLIAIFDLDNVSASGRSRPFLARAQEEGMIFPIGEELPKSMVVCCPRGSWQRIYLSPMAPATLQGRILGDTLSSGS